MNDASSSIFRIGTSGWTYKHWKECFYLAGLPQTRWFGHYASIFSTVEVNATFYRSFPPSTYLNWKQRAPHGFGYMLKAPRLITHRKYIHNVREDLEKFSRSCELLGDRFEMMLLQLAPNMPYDIEHLRAALQVCPAGRVAVEFRNEKWCTTETEEMLRACGAAWVNVDSPVQHLTELLTAKRAYIRLHGRQRWYTHDYSQAELNEIAVVAHHLADRGAEYVYIYFNNDFAGHAPANALALQKILQPDTISG